MGAELPLTVAKPVNMSNQNGVFHQNNQFSLQCSQLPIFPLWETNEGESWISEMEGWEGKVKGGDRGWGKWVFVYAAPLWVAAFAIAAVVFSADELWASFLFYCQF